MNIIEIQEMPEKDVRANLIRALALIEVLHRYHANRGPCDIGRCEAGKALHDFHAGKYISGATYEVEMIS